MSSPSDAVRIRRLEANRRWREKKRRLRDEDSRRRSLGGSSPKKPRLSSPIKDNSKSATDTTRNLPVKSPNPTMGTPKATSASSTKTALANNTKTSPILSPSLSKTPTAKNTPKITNKTPTENGKVHFELDKSLLDTLSRDQRLLNRQRRSEGKSESEVSTKDSTAESPKKKAKKESESDNYLSMTSTEKPRRGKRASLLSLIRVMPSRMSLPPPSIVREIKREPSPAKTPNARSRISRMSVPPRASILEKRIKREGEKTPPPTKKRGRPRKEDQVERMEKEEKKEDKSLSPMKTRLLQKKHQKENQQLVARCALCRATTGDLTACAECKSLYHLHKCMLYSEATIHRLAGRRWLCPRCVSCAVCHEFINDPENVECSGCGKVFHGKCRPKGAKSHRSGFFCSTCTKFAPPTSPTKLESVVVPDATVKDGRKGRKSRATMDEHKERQRETQELMTRRDDLYNKMMDTVMGSPSSSKGKPRTMDGPLALEEDVQLFEEAKRAAQLDSLKRKIEESPYQWVYVGSRRDRMRALYPSPYPRDIARSPRIFICPFCLRPNNDEVAFAVHQQECPWQTPPGNEIFRGADISFFEVDGADEKTYCQRVCLLGKLFISSKTLVNEVETFLFYVLTEHTDDGCQFVGYFSKEKNPAKNNNLSCLLTLPSAQKSGYGRLLIDLSYELSRLERKIGSPEHPLSDLGLFAYRGFWRSAILCYLRRLRGTAITSVKEMALATRIHPTDVINQLLRDGLLVFRNGAYYINTERRAYRMPLSASRRRVVDKTKLLWKPNYDPSTLDPFRLHYYV